MTDTVRDPTRDGAGPARATPRACATTVKGDTLGRWGGAGSDSWTSPGWPDPCWKGLWTSASPESVPLTVFPFRPLSARLSLAAPSLPLVVEPRPRVSGPHPPVVQASESFHRGPRNLNQGSCSPSASLHNSSPSLNPSLVRPKSSRTFQTSSPPLRRPPNFTENFISLALLAAGEAAGVKGPWSRHTLLPASPRRGIKVPLAHRPCK